MGKKYSEEITIMLKTYQKLSKDHFNMQNHLRELEVHLKNHLRNLNNDEREASNQNSMENVSDNVFQKPITHFFKVSPNKRTAAIIEDSGDANGSKKKRKIVDEI